MEYQKMKQTFKALADEKRLMILEELQTGEQCACDLIESLEIAQSALSYHMKILCDANLVLARQEGKWTYYTLNIETKEELIQDIHEIFCVYVEMETNQYTNCE